MREGREQRYKKSTWEGRKKGIKERTKEGIKAGKKKGGEMIAGRKGGLQRNIDI